jgi:hypothetical protein
MRQITNEHLNQLLSRAGIQVADPILNIGRELSYLENQRRIVVVHLAEPEKLEYASAVMARILEMDEEWLLLIRYGSVSDLGLLPECSDATAISFSNGERSALVNYLCTRSTDIGSISADLYTLGEKGETLVTWDYHATDDGIIVKLQSVADTSRLLVSLNELGAEFEVFYNDR